MPKRTIQPRKLGRSHLLESEAERTTRIDALRESFLSWFRTVPGAEWESTEDPMVLGCRWFLSESRPDWGKTFCAFRIDRPVVDAQLIVDARDPGYLPQGAEWDLLGLDSSHVTREQTIAAYHAQSKGKNERDRRLLTAAYGRVLNHLWYLEYDSDGRKGVK